MKLSLHHTHDFEKKTTFIQAICHKLEKRRADFFQFKITQMQFVSILSICVHPASRSFCCISSMLFNSFKWLLQCFVLLFGHFGWHLKLHHSEAHSTGMFKLRKHIEKTFKPKPTISSVVNLEAQYSFFFR